MGLTIHYRLTLPGHTPFDEVRAKLAALKQFADTVGFERVLGPSEYTTDELAGPHNRDIVRILASTFSADPPDFYGITSGEPCAVSFCIVPGRKCEPAAFAFVAPGARRRDEGDDEVDLHPADWFWSAFCKTQYASLVSDDHLLHCHLGLVRVLEHASTLGIDVEVHDETGYWEHRSTEKLLAAVRDMNRLVAQFAGALNDRLGDEHSVEAPIFDHPDFEHLEMERLGGVEQADGDATEREP